MDGILDDGGLTELLLVSGVLILASTLFYGSPAAQEEHQTKVRPVTESVADKATTGHDFDELSPRGKEVFRSAMNVR